MLRTLKPPSAPFVVCPELNSVQHTGTKIPINCDQTGHWSNRTFENITKCICGNETRQGASLWPRLCTGVSGLLRGGAGWGRGSGSSLPRTPGLPGTLPNLHLAGARSTWESSFRLMGTPHSPLLCLQRSNCSFPCFIHHFLLSFRVTETTCGHRRTFSCCFPLVSSSLVLAAAPAQFTGWVGGGGPWAQSRLERTR